MRIALLLVPAIIIVGCRKKPDPPVYVDPSLPSVKFVFNNVVNEKSLVLNNEHYVNENGDSFTVSSYKYYVTNVKLIMENGESISETNSYHLIDHADTSSRSFVVSHISAGRYNKISFLIGVDSLRNVSGAQTGALDPAKTMFWDWNTGYIMARMEGKSSRANPNMLAFHLGGFSGPEKALRWVTLPLSETVIADSNKVPEVNISSDLAEWFKTPNLIDFSKMSIVTLPGVEGTQIADNYADMFKVTGVKQ